MVLSPDQECPATLWTPSVAYPTNGNIRLTDSFLRPDGNKNSPVEVVHRYSADRRIGLSVKALWAVRTDQGDGVSISVTLNGHKLATWSGKGAHSYVSKPLILKTGDQLDFNVGQNGNSVGDVTDYRITLRETR